MAENQAGGAQPAGLLASLRAFGGTLIAVVHTRLELASTELEEERERVKSLVFLMSAATFFLAFGMLLATLFIVVAFWETSRLAVIGGFALFYLGLGGWAAVALRRRSRTRGRLFAATLGELARDREALRQ